MPFGERRGWLERLAEKNPAVVAGAPMPSKAARKAQARLDDAPPVTEKPARVLGKKPNHYESDQQTVCIDWARALYPELAQLLFAIPNGGHRHKAVAQQLQDEGVVPGVPDLLLAQPRGGYAGLFLENKYGANDLSENQTELITALVAQGYLVAVFFTVAQFQAIVADYLAQPPTMLVAPPGTIFTTH